MNNYLNSDFELLVILQLQNKFRLIEPVISMRCSSCWLSFVQSIILHLLNKMFKTWKYKKKKVLLNALVKSSKLRNALGQQLNLCDTQETQLLLGQAYGSGG